MKYKKISQELREEIIDKIIDVEPEFKNYDKIKELIELDLNLSHGDYSKI